MRQVLSAERRHDSDAGLPGRLGHDQTARFGICDGGIFAGFHAVRRDLFCLAFQQKNGHNSQVSDPFRNADAGAADGSDRDAEPAASPESVTYAKKAGNYGQGPFEAGKCR